MKEQEVIICNKAQDEMIEKFGLFVTYFLFWLPKYDRWYQKRKRELKCQN